MSNETNEEYVGSTCLPLYKRLYQHRLMARVYPERKVYRVLNSIGWQHVKIILLEEAKCEHKEQLRAKEQEWISRLSPTLNSNRVIDSCSHGRVASRCQDCENSSGICVHKHQRTQCWRCSHQRTYCSVCSAWIPHPTAYRKHCLSNKHEKNELEAIGLLFASDF